MKSLQNFEADYRETYGLIRYALGRFPGLQAHAEDLIQDVYLSYWQHREAIPLEKRRAWVEMEPQEGLWKSDLVHETRLMKIGQLLDKLPQGSATQTFQRFYRDGDNLKAIARDRQESIGTVASRLSRMREKLRPHFREALEALDA